VWESDQWHNYSVFVVVRLINTKAINYHRTYQHKTNVCAVMAILLHSHTAAPKYFVKTSLFFTLPVLSVVSGMNREEASTPPPSRASDYPS
jgi:hypothetical protein